MKLIDKYMNAVAYYLPVKRRDEIVRELRANILDQLENQFEHSTEEELSVILTNMGHPQKVAAQYFPPQKLVSEELFPLYKQTLNYGLILVFMIKVIQASIIFISSAHLNIFGFIFGFINTSLLMFAVATGIFYVFSNPPGGKPLFKINDCWTPEKLPAINFKWQRISACDQASEFSFSVFLILVLHHQILMSEQALQSLSLNFSDSTTLWIPWLTATFLVSLVFNVWNLRFGFWMASKLYIAVIINALSAILLLYMSFLPELVVATTLNETASNETVKKLVPIFNHVLKSGFVVTGLWFVYESIRDLYRILLLKKSEASDSLQ